MMIVTAVATVIMKSHILMEVWNMKSIDCKDGKECRYEKN